jgi:hypothetical protein
MTLSEPVRAALIGATVTIAVSLLQLAVNARRQAAERAAGKPASRKTGNWLATFALMLACGVGGYAFSEYQTFQDRADSRLLREEMQMRLKDIGAVAARLERATVQGNDAVGTDAGFAAERKRGSEGVAAVMNVPACQGAPAGLAQVSRACTPADALQLTLCAMVPLPAVINDVQLFLRPEESRQPWDEVKVLAGQDAGGAMFLDNHFERASEGNTKEVCMRLMSWGGDQGRSARVLVRYVI